MNRHVFLIGSLLLAAGMVSAAPVDRYGQATDENWPGKVTSDEQLRTDAAEEWETLKLQVLDSRRFDRYGGVIEQRKYRATGFFRLEKIDDRWWFITPEGNRFFLIGADSVHWNEGGYSTPLQDRGKPRSELPELPNREQFPEAYARSGRVNFLGANLKRKYGPDFDRKLDDIIRRRFLAWGFNSSAKWGWGKTVEGIPYFEDANIAKAIKIHSKFRWIDMYDPEFAAKVDTSVKQVCERRKGDPMLLGYALENENGWSYFGIATILQETRPELHMKRALLNFVAAKHEDGIAAVAEMAGKPGASLEELMTVPLLLSAFPADEVREFVLESSRLYHRTIRDAYRKYDPDHLFMGASHCVYQSGEWIRGAAEYVDFIGVHSYETDLGWFKQYQEIVRELDKPFAVLEFSFVQAYRGMKAYGHGNTVKSERERGLCYRRFTENIATDPHCLGFGYFIFWDQPSTGRAIGGESHNFGLLNQCDQPYVEMIQEVKKANKKLFRLHDGREKPVAMLRPSIHTGELLKQIYAPFLPDSISLYSTADVGAPEWFYGEGRVKIQEPVPIGNYFFGTVDLKKNRASQVVMRAFLWNRPGVSDMPLMEESADNRNFTPVETEMRPGRKGGEHYSEYLITNRVPFQKATRYVRIGVRVADPSKSWAVQFCGLNLIPEQP